MARAAVCLAVIGITMGGFTSASGQTVSEVLRALQDRKVVLEIRNTYGYTSTGPGTLRTLQTIKWPNGLPDYPQESNITSQALAIQALAQASREFDKLKGYFLAYDAVNKRLANFEMEGAASPAEYTAADNSYAASSAGSPSSMGSDITPISGLPSVGTAKLSGVLTLPSVGEVNADNWREKLRQLASNINQLTALQWPIYVETGRGYFSTKGDWSNFSAHDIYSSEEIYFPGAFSTMGGSDPYSNPYFTPSVFVTDLFNGNKMIFGGASSGISFLPGIDWTAHAGTWFDGQLLGKSEGSSGELDAVVGAYVSYDTHNGEILPDGTGSHVGTLTIFKAPFVAPWGDVTESLAKQNLDKCRMGVMQPLATPLDKQTYGDYGGIPPASLTSFITDAFTLMDIDVPSFHGTVAEETDIDAIVDDVTPDFTAYYCPLENYGATKRRHYDFVEPFEGNVLWKPMDTLPDLPKLPVGSRYDMHVGMLPIATFAFNKLPVSAAGVLQHLPGEIETTLVNNELFRVHLGRGKTDLAQEAWLGGRPDGFGSLRFYGSGSEFEPIYQDNSEQYGDDPDGKGANIPPVTFDVLKDFPDLEKQQSGWQSRFAYTTAWFSPRLKQVMGGDVFVDITYERYYKTVNFYWAKDIGPKSGTFYDVGAAPIIKSVTIQNPTAGAQTGTGDYLPTEANHLRISDGGKYFEITYQPVTDFTVLKPKATYKFDVSNTSGGGGGDGGEGETCTIEVAYDSTGAETGTWSITWEQDGDESGGNTYTGEAVWHKATGRQAQLAILSPLVSDRPEMDSFQVTGPHENRRVDQVWSSPDTSTEYCTLTKATYTGGTEWPMNGHVISYDPAGVSITDKWTSSSGRQFETDNTWAGNVHTVSKQVDSNVLRTVEENFTSTTKADLSIGGEKVATLTYTGGDGGDTPAWTVASASYVNGLNEQRNYAMNADRSVSTSSTSTWGTSGLTTVSTAQYDLFGNLIGQTQTIDGVPVDKLAADANTTKNGWGAPNTLTGLQGEKLNVTYANDGALFGQVLSVQDDALKTFGITGSDWRGRPTKYNTGFDQLTPDYSSPQSVKITADSSYTETIGLSDFADTQSVTSTLGSGSSFVFNPDGDSMMTIAGRRRTLNVDSEGFLSKISNGGGSRGKTMTMAAGGGGFSTQEAILDMSGSPSGLMIFSSYDGMGRIISRTLPAEDGSWQTETWSYDTANRSVTYSPVPGPSVQTVKSTLSANGRVRTIKVGNNDLYRYTSSVANGKLSFQTEKNDDSGGGGPVWKTVSMDTIDPANGQVTTAPWNNMANAVTVKSTVASAGHAASTEITDGLTGSDVTITMAGDLPKGITGTANGLALAINNVNFTAGRFTNLSGTVGGMPVGLGADTDGRVTNVSGPGTNTNVTYGGGDGFEIDTNDTVRGLSTTTTADSIGNLTGVRGDGQIGLSLSTTDAADGSGTETTINGSVTVKSNFYGSTTSKSYTGLTETNSLNSDGTLAGMDQGDGDAMISQTPTSTTVTSPDGTVITENRYLSGPRSEIIGPMDHRTFTHEKMQPATETYSGEIWHGWSLNWTLDGKDRPSTLTISDGQGLLRTFTYGYDAFSRLNLSQSGAVTGTLSRDGAGRPASMTRTGGATSLWTFDAGTGWMSGYSDTAGATGQTFGYVRDGQGRISNRTGTNAVDWSALNYDGTTGGLTHASVSGRSFAYGYDSRGNRDTEGALATNGLNALNQINNRNLTSRSLSVYGSADPKAEVRVFNPFAGLTGTVLSPDVNTGSFFGSWNVPSDWNGGSAGRADVTVRGTLHGPLQGQKDAVAELNFGVVLPSVQEAMQYDGAGRLKSDAYWTYTWGGPGWLKSMTRKSGTSIQANVQSETVDFTYDADGRRVGKRHTITYNDNSTSTEESQVLWSGWLPVLEMYTRDGIYKYRRWFQWGPDISGTLDGAGGIGGLVAIIQEDQDNNQRVLLPLQDGLGNITAVVDNSSGEIVARYDYGPFGEPLRESGDVDACPFRFQTKFFDKESAHYYFGFRYYDPRLGRWLSRDPLGEAGGFNLYAYCGNDPVNGHDYLGMANGVLAPIVDGPQVPAVEGLTTQAELDVELTELSRQTAKVGFKRVLGTVGPVVTAGVAGWEVGSFIYNKSPVVRKTGFNFFYYGFFWDAETTRSEIFSQNPSPNIHTGKNFILETQDDWDDFAEYLRLRYVDPERAQRVITRHRNKKMQSSGGVPALTPYSIRPDALVWMRLADILPASNPFGRNMAGSIMEDANQEGVLRDLRIFFLKLDYQIPGALSPKNLLRLRGFDNGSNPVAPRIDEDWIKFFPEHAPFMLDIIEHHHILGSPYAIPIPRRLHRQEGNYNFWHDNQR